MRQYEGPRKVGWSNAPAPLVARYVNHGASPQEHPMTGWHAVPSKPSIDTAGYPPIRRPLPPDSGCTGAGRHEPSKQPALSKAEAPSARHNEVVKHPDVDELQRVLQSPGDHLVRRTRLRDAAGMIVHQDARSGIPPQSFLHDFPRMDACGIDRATEELLAFDDAMPGVEVDDAEDFVRQLAKA